MESYGKVLKFGYYSEQQMERTKNDLGLSMPMIFLTHCADFYRNHAKRDPYIEELKLLDRFASQMQKEPLSLALRELYTNDSCVAETYGDMMQKRNQLTPDAGSPVTAKEAASLATNALLRAGKQATRMNVTPFTEFKNGKPRISFLSLCKESPAQTDLFALLLPSESEGNDNNGLDRLLSDQVFTQKIKSIRSISSGGILAELLRECDGFRVEPDRLTPPNSPVSLSILTEAYPDAYFIRIPREQEEAIFYNAKELGVRILTFASVEKGCEMTIRNKQKELFRLDTTFLRSLLAQRLFTAKLANEKDGTLSAPSQAAPIKFTNSICCAEVTNHPQNAFFTNALYTALLAVIDQSLTGCAYSDQRLSVCLRVPKKSNGASDSACVSILIGLYRLQAELGILAVEPLTVRDEAIASPSLSVFAFGTGIPLHTRLQGEGNSVYLLSITTQENGLPDFGELRKLFNQLCDLRKNGDLISACAVCGESPEAALQKIAAEEIGCHADGEQLASLPASPILIALESRIPIEKALFVGTTFQKDSHFGDFLGQMEKN